MMDASPTPLAVLLAAMRARWQAGDLDGAASLARAAAPYLHPRRGAVPHRPDADADLDHLSDAELDLLLAQAAGREGIAGEAAGQPD